MFLDDFINFAHERLLENGEAQEYLLKRGVSCHQWARHKLGFVDVPFSFNKNDYPLHDDKACKDFENKHLRCDACKLLNWSSTWESDEEQEKKVMKPFQKLFGSIVLPITTYSKSITGFQVRNIKEKVYDTFMLKRRPEPMFFGIASAIDRVWETGEVTLTEGPFDQLIYERLVDRGVVALMTNSVSKTQFKFLKRFVNKINLCLDFDKAGREGTNNFLKLFSNDFHVKNVRFSSMGGCKDLGALWEKLGDKKFSQIVSSALV